ncbi:MAG: oligoribonuclease [Candidatus Babeliaceae bacterium]|nr:oligoribonuclease [Candidatus Babeliaceae bacterium]
MTGLNPECDHILEIAVIGSDVTLKHLTEGPSIIIHQPRSILETMGEWVTEHHQASGLWDAVLASTISVEEAENEVITFVKTYCSSKRLLLAGNTVYQDRLFLRRYMPRLESLFHYRLVDVSTIKELVKAWYPQSSFANFKKKKQHRALDDIRESIDELRYYREHFFVNKT